MTFIADVFKRSCVTCSSVPSCPTCDDGEECIMTTQTCDACPTTYCTSVSTGSNDNSDAKKKVGGIAGGIIGFFIVAGAIGFYVFYKYYYKPRQYLKEKDEEFKYHLNEENVISDGSNPNNNGSNTESTLNSRRLSQVTLSTMAASVLTKASNVIPIAYIPGVTVKYQQKKPTPSIYSDIDNASIIGGNTMGPGGVYANNASSMTTTAIRAKPKLVNIDRDEEAEFGSGNEENIPKTAVSIVNLGGVRTVKINNAKKQKAVKQPKSYQPVLQNDLIEEEEEEETGEQEQYQDQEGNADEASGQDRDLDEEDEGSLFDLNIELDGNVNPLSPFNNNNVIEEVPESDTATTSDDDDDDDHEHSIEGLSDDDEYDPTILRN